MSLKDGDPSGTTDHHRKVETFSPSVLDLGCARFTENLSELTKTWSSGATECGV